MKVNRTKGFARKNERITASHQRSQRFLIISGVVVLQAQVSDAVLTIFTRAAFENTLVMCYK